MSITWDDLTVGDELPARTFGPVERTDLIRYAGASGDFNPNHTIDDSARSAGFPSVFAHGMFHAGVMATVLTDAFGSRSVRRLRVQFREQVWPGDLLTFSGLVTARDEVRRAVELELTCTREGGGTALRGWATCVVDTDLVAATGGTDGTDRAARAPGAPGAADGG